ncbi:restriction endonuclease subunit S [Marinobacter subterrani]|uniref:restriction endonuclease subunit S n=1 Tax=Marinobacter subterrani TaxID=1658765 RepID=UPI0023530C1A|nr:restriction endonuclease subunit S [Marinobacter subterrani]
MHQSEWHREKFGDFFDIRSGVGFKYDEYVNSGIPLVKIDNVSHGFIKWENRSYLPESYVNDFPEIVLKEGDILLALNRPITRGQLKIARISASDLPAILYQRVGKIIALTEQTLPNFYYYLFDRLIFRFVSRKSIGSDQPFISITDLKKEPIPLPPVTEQKKIAQILSTWDQAITATERLLENSQQRKKGLMQQLLTGRKRLPGFEGEFKATSLSAAATITMGTSPKSAAYNSIGDGLPLLQGNADIEGRRSKPRVFTSEVTKVCQLGDILLSVRAPVGSVATSNHDACIGRGICAIKAKNKNNQEFLYQWMLWYEPRWAGLSQGSTFESVNSSDLKNLEIKLPEPAEQKAISNVLSVADRESELLENRLDQLKQEKKALMQQLLTGKRRVQVDTEAA